MFVSLCSSYRTSKVSVLISREMMQKSQVVSVSVQKCVAGVFSWGWASKLLVMMEVGV